MHAKYTNYIKWTSGIPVSQLTVENNLGYEVLCLIFYVIKHEKNSVIYIYIKLCCYIVFICYSYGVTLIIMCIVLSNVYISRFRTFKQMVVSLSHVTI